MSTELITIQWGKDRFQVQLPDPEAPLNNLKQLIESRTGVPINQQKLVWGGAILAKDLPLKAYGLHTATHTLSGTTNESSYPGFTTLLRQWGLSKPKQREKVITLIGSKDVARPPPSYQQPSKKSGESASESEALEMIKKMKEDALAKLQPLLDKAEGRPVDEAKLEQIPQERLIPYLSETLLQLLLRLDSVTLQTEWMDARKSRKDGVREVQALLDRVDILKSNPKPAEQTGETEEQPKAGDTVIR